MVMMVMMIMMIMRIMMTTIVMEELNLWQISKVHTSHHGSTKFSALKHHFSFGQFCFFHIEIGSN